MWKLEVLSHDMAQYLMAKGKIMWGVQNAVPRLQLHINTYTLYFVPGTHRTDTRSITIPDEGGFRGEDDGFEVDRCKRCGQ